MARDRLLGRDFGRYHVDAVIGRGGMGVVYRARDRRLDRTVALKVLSDERAADAGFRERFLRESRLLASIDHPNIVPVYEADEADGDLFIAMRFVQGPELRRIIERDGPLSPGRAVAIIAQVADALDAAHAAGLIHRDIKPANILVVSGPSADHAYLTDFGLTKLAGESTGLTQAGQFVGTPGYVAPEQIQGKTVDHRADIYALGCVLYDCLTGAVPYPRDSTMASLWAHVHEPPPKVSDARPGLAGDLDGVISKALAKLPDQRFQTAGGLALAARKAVPATEPALPTVVMAAMPDEAPVTATEAPASSPSTVGGPITEDQTYQPAALTESAPAAGLAATTAAGVSTQATELIGDSTVVSGRTTRLDLGATEVASGGGAPPPPSWRASGDGPRGRRWPSAPIATVAIVVVLALAGSALAFGTGLVNFKGAANVASPTGVVFATPRAGGGGIVATPSSSPPSGPASASPSSSPTKPPPTPTPTPTPTPSPTPRPDREGPTGSVRINGNTSTVRDLAVSLRLSASDRSGVGRVTISNTTSISAGRTYTWPTGASAWTKSWNLSGPIAHNGTRYVYVWYYDKLGHRSTRFRDAIKYSNRAPTIANGGTLSFYANTASGGPCGRSTYCYIFVMTKVSDADHDPVRLSSVGSTANGGSAAVSMYQGKQVVRYYAGSANPGTDDRLYFYVKDDHGHTTRGALYIYNLPP